MSLFNELQGTLIHDPKTTYSYLKVRKQEKESEGDEEKDRKAKRKELCAKKKQELSKEEFNKRRAKERYQWNKKERSKKQLDKYYKDKAEEEEMMEDIYKTVYDTIPDPIGVDEYYAQKYRDDDVGYNGRLKFSRWASRLNWVKPSKEERYDNPVRVYKPGGFKLMFSRLGDMQDKAYEYMKQHINEVTLKDFRLSKKQGLTKNPMWAVNGKMRELVENPDISDNQICSVASAMLRDKYIVNELYMGRANFLVGDVIITQAGNIIRPCLENNIPWLTPDTVDELHKKRTDWLKRKTDDLKIYILRDCYLLKEQPNERETLFYFTPT